MKFWLLFLICLLLVWLLFAKPDLDDEYRKTEQLLSAEATLRSQALTNAMEQHRLASVLLARSSIIEEIIQHPEPGDEYLDKIRYLQALASVRSISVLKRHTRDRFPEFNPPAELVRSGQWARAVTTAFQGSLGRAFYVDEENTPIYLFLAPHFEPGQEPSAAILTVINLGLIGDSWQVSANHIALWTHQGELMIENNVVASDDAIMVERNHSQLNATLRVSAAPPPLFGSWWLRSVMVSLLFTVAGLLLLRQLERRSFLTKLADQQASEAQRLELEIDHQKGELEAAQRQLMRSEKLALLGQMSASISHEINQPLAALKNYANTASRLLEKNKQNEVGQNLQLISGLTDRISRVVVNLRSFASNEPSLVQPVEISSIIREAIGELIDRFPDAREYCAFILTPESEPVYALAGRIRLLQVLGNLLTNAWYACHGRADPSITVELQPSKDTVCIRVTDNGPGFNPEISHSAFDAFVSSRDISNDDNIRMGLGLSISRSFIESMNGTLILESSTAAGAVLMITLQVISDH